MFDYFVANKVFIHKYNRQNVMNYFQHFLEQLLCGFLEQMEMDECGCLTGSTTTLAIPMQ